MELSDLFKKYSSIINASHSQGVIASKYSASPSLGEQSHSAVTAQNKNIRCPDCDTIMKINSAELICAECGRVDQHELSLAPISIPEGRSVRIQSTTRSKIFNVGGNYQTTQHHVVLKQLTNANENNQQFNANGSQNVIPKLILNEVADLYNKIQQLPAPSKKKNALVLDQNVAPKKIVLRGSHKDKVLAALIYFVSINHKIHREQADIARFLGLPKSGFSDGMKFVRNLVSKGDLDLQINDIEMCNAETIADRYFESLNCVAVSNNSAKYKQLVIQIVKFSEEKFIGPNIEVRSKVAGSIFYCAAHLGAPYTIEQIEKCADGIKKNTFRRFYDIIVKYESEFKPIISGPDANISIETNIGKQEIVIETADSELRSSFDAETN